MNDRMKEFEKQDKEAEQSLLIKMIDSITNYARFSHPQKIQLQAALLEIVEQVQKYNPQYFKSEA